MQHKFTTLALMAGLSIMGNAHAALIDRGSGLIYDDILNITWLQDANYAKTSGYDADGRMAWDDAMAWAANLSFGGYDDWRLPTMIDTGAPGCNYANSGTDCGFNVQTYDAGSGTVFSELAYMYYFNLGLTGLFNPDDTERTDYGIFGNGTEFGQADIGLFVNLQSSAYWTGLEFVPRTDLAGVFATQNGQQGALHKLVMGSVPFAWAVRSGDVVSTSNVPEPATLALMGLGLAGLGAMRRRAV